MEVKLINSKGTKYYNYHKWDNDKYSVYDYERYGLLNKLISHEIIETKNESLNVLLQYIEDSMVFLMKYIDILKNFKNVRWKNR